MPKGVGIDNYVISRRKKVNLDDVHPDPENVRDRYPREGLIILANSIANNGQLQPALMEQGGGGYSLIAGHRRYWSSVLAYESGWKDPTMVGKIVRPLPPELRLRAQCAENECKEQISRYNLSNVFWERYKPTFIHAVDGLSQEDCELIRDAENFWEIPSSLRSAFPISQYSKMMGFGEDMVRRAFHFQTLHGDIKRQVQQGILSFSAACELVKIPGRNEQRRLLGLIKKGGEATQYKVREATKEYLESVHQEELTGSFLQMQKPSRGRNERMRDLSKYIGDAEKVVRTLDSIAEIFSGVKDIEMAINSHTTTPGNIARESYDSLLPIHQRLLEDGAYLHRWEFVPKGSSLEEFVLANHSERGENRGTVMDHVKSVMLPVEDIKPNPLNPRGRKESFDEESIQKLSNSIAETGLIHDVLVMKTPEGRYVNLEGHRRHAALSLLAKKGKVDKIGALVVPQLSEEQQIMLMCDSDLFEEISQDAKARSIARQYRLDNESSGGELSVSDFIAANKDKWSSKVIRNSIAYDCLPEAVKMMQSRGIISYGTAVEISEAEGEESQKDFAVSAAILGQSRKEIREELKNSGGGLLLDGGEINEMKRLGELRVLGTTLENDLNGTKERMRRIIENERDLSLFLSDEVSVAKFQRLMKNLGEVVDG